MVPADMSSRTHLWLRVAALVVIAAAALLPRASASVGASGSASAAQSSEHAPLDLRIEANEATTINASTVGVARR